MQKYVLLTVFLIFPFLAYSQEGEINQFDANGRKTGFWSKNYSNGNVMYEGYFTEGNPVGTMKRYFAEGGVSALINFSGDGNTSFATLYYENGQKAAEGKFIGQLKDSIWNYFSFYNKRLAISEEWKNGKLNGPTKKYFDDGSIAEITHWHEGTQEGLWEQYYENGALRLRSWYKNGNLDGAFKSYTSDGKPFISGSYTNGKMDGSWIFHANEGNPETKAEYKEGTLLPNPELKKRQEDFSREIEKIIGKFPEPGGEGKRY